MLRFTFYFTRQTNGTEAARKDLKKRKICLALKIKTLSPDFDFYFPLISPHFFFFSHPPLVKNQDSRTFEIYSIFHPCFFLSPSSSMAIIHVRRRMVPMTTRIRRVGCKKTVPNRKHSLSLKKELLAQRIEDESQESLISSEFRFQTSYQVISNASYLSMYMKFDHTSWNQNNALRM